MKLEKWERRPAQIIAVRVTAENIGEVAQWCGGTVKEDNANSGPYIWVPVPKDSTEKQRRAYIGKWVISVGKNNWRVYTDKSLRAGFMPASPALHINERELYAVVTEPLIQDDPNYGEVLDLINENELTEKRHIDDIYQQPHTD